MASILIVEDEAVLAKNIKRTLQRLGHEAVTAGSCADAERIFNERQPDLALLDLRLPDGSGLNLLKRFRTARPAAATIMMTAHATVEDAVQAIKIGALDYLQKPLRMEDVAHAVTRALEEAQLRSEVSYYRSRNAQGTRIDEIEGSCPAICELRSRLERLCSLDAAAAPTVLITGETGTGKGLVARSLHYNGPRAGRPFIEVNCAAIPENLVESELFGHEKGAFTDARTASAGLFQAAHGGTLFLDEIGCLLPSIQVKLLKAIEEKSVRPVGGGAPRKIDVQVIAATNSDLSAMVAEGTFRQDLFHRLAVARLDVPPLRERGDDILLLAHRFLGELIARYRTPAKRLGPDAERSLREYSWPGNVRELRNTLDRAVLFCEGEIIDARALGLPEAPPPRVELAVDENGALEVKLPERGFRFEDLERSVLEEALRATGGSQSAAARLLGMTRATLRYRLEKFGISGPGSPAEGATHG